MASTSSLKAGEAFIIIRAVDQASPVFKRLSRQMIDMGRSMRNFGVSIAAVGAGITAAFIRPIKIASEVTEQQNKFFQIFGTKIGKDVESRMKSLGDETGRTYLKMYQFAGSFGGLLKGQGATTKQAAELTKALLKMGVDFSSFNDILDDTREGSMRRFTSALSGSAEVLDQYGVAAKESALGPALEQMFGVGVRGATELQKSVARTYLIWKSMAQQNALGDAPRTIAEFANVVRNVKDVWYEIQYHVGKALLPLVGSLAQLILRIGIYMADWVQHHRDLIIIIAMIGAGLLTIGSIITAIGASAMVAGYVFFGISQIMVAIKVISLAIAAIWAFIGAHFWAIVAVLSAIVALVALWLWSAAELTRIWQEQLSWLYSIGLSIWKAFSTGKLDLAWKLFFVTMKIGWEAAIMTAQKALAGIYNLVMRIGTYAAMGFVNVFDAAWVGIRLAFYALRIDLMRGIEAVTRFAANTLKAWGMSGLGNQLTKMAGEVERRRGEDLEAQKDISVDFRNRLKERSQLRDDYLKQSEGVSKQWYQDNERRIEGLKSRAFELQQQIKGVDTNENIIPKEPQGSTAGSVAKMMSYEMPDALAKGTIAATKAASKNSQTAALSELVRLQEEANAQQKEGNDMLQEIYESTGAVP